MVTNTIVYAYTAFQVVGDSMDNGTRSSFEDGDKLLTLPIDISEFRDTINDSLDSFWVIETKTGILLKQITEYNVSTDMITCHSLNPSADYSDYQIPIEHINKIYRVVQKQGRPIYYSD